MLFNVLEPYRPDADVLFVDDGTSDRYTCYVWGLDDIGVYASYWDVSGNMGIDNSVINLGWGTIIVAGWGVASVPALTDDTPYRDFLDNGGNLAVIDQDYFYGNNLPATGTFVTGDFAYDYLGLGDFNNDPTPADANYVGAEGDIITDPFVDDYYLTYWDTTGIHMGEASFWADYFTTNLATYNFVGEIDGNTYGCAYDEGTFKTVFLSFMAEANCEIQSFPGGDTWVPTDQFRTLLTGIFNFFGSAGVDNKIELSPVKYSLDQNYPNPFNPTTTINFNLANSGKVTLKVFNMLGQEVASIIEGNMSAGNHTINFDASSLSSGVYYYKLNACDFEATKEMLLVK
jgi:hypothetical protein